MTLKGLPFGFDTEVIEGQFYWSPSLGFYYWLRKIDGDALHWVLIEGYQHDTFMQIEFIQRGAHVKGYVPVADPDVRARLTRRVEEFEMPRERPAPSVHAVGAAK